jgi:hypothetical protein
MIPRRRSYYIIVSLIICFSIFVSPPIFLAEVGNDLEQQAFSDFEKGVFNLVTSSMEPLNRLNKLGNKIDEGDLYNIALMAKDRLAKNSLALVKLKIPIVLPDGVKTSLEEVKCELSIGFRAMEESMDYLAQYAVTLNPVLYDKYVEKYDKGFIYIDGGLTSLATARLRLKAPKRPSPDAWQVKKNRFYQLEKTVPINGRPNRINR